MSADAAKRFEYEMAFQRGLVVMTKRQDPLGTTARWIHKARTESWLLEQLDLPIEIDGTAMEPIEDSRMFGAYYWQVLRELVLIRDGRACRICGRSPGSLEIHHILPRHLGGHDVPTNLVALCTTCHDAVHRRMDRPSAIDHRQTVLDDLAGEQEDERWLTS